MSNALMIIYLSLYVLLYCKMVILIHSLPYDIPIQKISHMNLLILFFYLLLFSITLILFKIFILMEFYNSY